MTTYMWRALAALEFFVLGAMGGLFLDWAIYHTIDPVDVGPVAYVAFLVPCFMAASVLFYFAFLCLCVAIFGEE